MTAIMAPADSSEVQECLCQASTAGQRLRVQGAGTRPVRRFGCAQLLSTGALSGIEDLDPEELVLTAASGTSLSSIEEALRPHGLMLPPWYPGCTAGTLGGLYSDPREGPCHGRVGFTRDHVLGIEAVRGDGVPFKAGGRVVKNVTGYDVTRLLCGARGKLGVVTRLHWRLLALPERLLRAEVLCESSSSFWNGARQLREQGIDPLLLMLKPKPSFQVQILEWGRAGIAENRLQKQLETLGGKRLQEGAVHPYDFETPVHEDPDTSRPRVRVRLPFSRWSELLEKLHLRWLGVYPFAHFGIAELPASTPLKKLSCQVQEFGGSVTLETIPVSWPQDLDAGDLHGRNPLKLLEKRLREEWDSQGVLWHEE
ncbi:MAG: FAD-binding oxidoreductase [Planctomycetota bacterium]